MNTICWRMVIAAVVVGGVPGLVSAQHGPPPGGYPRSGYSPYLNLTRGGNPAVNYYGLVRPEFRAQNAYQNLQQQVNQLAQSGASDLQQTTGILPPTGYPARFQDYARYFPGAPIGPGLARPGGLSGSSVRQPGMSGNPVPLRGIR